MVGLRAPILGSFRDSIAGPLRQWSSHDPIQRRPNLLPNTAGVHTMYGRLTEVFVIPQGLFWPISAWILRVVPRATGSFVLLSCMQRERERERRERERERERERDLQWVFLVQLSPAKIAIFLQFPLQQRSPGWKQNYNVSYYYCRQCIFKRGWAAGCNRHASSLTLTMY